MSARCPSGRFRNSRTSMTRPSSSTAAAASVSLCESMPIATPTAGLLSPADLRWWPAEDTQALGWTSLLSSHFRRPGSGRRDDQVKSQRPRRPRHAKTESPPAGSGTLSPEGGTHRGISYACGKVERFHQTLKRWLIKQEPAATLADLEAQLDRFGGYYG